VGTMGSTFVPAFLQGSPTISAQLRKYLGRYAYLMQFRDEDECLELVNRSKYGWRIAWCDRDLKSCTTRC